MSNLTNPRGSWAVRRGIARFPRFGIGLVAAAGALALGVAAIGPVSAQSLHATTNAAAAAGGVYTAVTPTRLLDTRATDATLGGDGYYSLTVTGGTAGVPANATAVALNVTVTNTTDSGYLSVYPAGATQPTVSNLNWVMGETVANSVIVPVGTAGQVTFFNHTGNTDVVADLEGYFAPQTTGTAGEYSPITPARITDTRTGSGEANAGDTLTAGGTLNVQVSGVGGVPAGASAAILNVTATDTTAASYFTAYPEGVARPTASNLNWMAGGTVANRVVVPLSSTGQITLYNYVGSADAVIDVDGFFTSGSGAVPANASVYSSITPIRVLDTRTAGGTLGAGGIHTVQLSGVDGIAAAATAVVTNVTAANTTAASFFTVYPSTSAQPTASDVNWSAGQIVPNLTVATLGTTGAVDVYNHAGSADLIVDAFGYFASTGALEISSVVVTNTTITVTYNQAVTCPGTGADGDFAYDWTGSASGGAVTGCTTSGDVATLTGTFTLPSGTATLTYTAPATSTTANAVNATNAPTTFASTQTIAPAAAFAPAMVSAYVTTTTVVITYNENVSCPATGADGDFVYDTTGINSGGTATGCTTAGNVLTLAGTFAAPGTGPSITYTAPATNSGTASVWATGSTPASYAATQTITDFTTPAITGAVVTAGASGTGTIVVTYSGDGVMTCPTTGGATVQTEFVYSNGGTPAYPSTCASISTHVITLGTFYAANTGTTGATLVLPGASDTLTYTAPAATNTTANSVHDTLDFPQFAATQSFALTATAAPTMNSAVVTTGTSIAITFSAAVSCSALGVDGDFVYDSAVSVPGGTATGCSSAGAVLTLTGNFNAESGSASLTYTEPGTPSTSNAVYATGTTTDFVATTTISGASIT